jgi:hypothetical protein
VGGVTPLFAMKNADKKWGDFALCGPSFQTRKTAILVGFIGMEWGKRCF